MPADAMAAVRPRGGSGQSRAGGADDAGAKRLSIRLLIPPDPCAVRRALERIRAEFAGVGLGCDDAAVAELVLAEVLNNVVEHACPERQGGPIELSIRARDDGLVCEVRDQGCPMPGQALPEGAAPLAEGALDELPEGGFGWFLIRSLARDLAYSRRNGANRLVFRLPSCDAACSNRDSPASATCLEDAPIPPKRGPESV